MYNHTDQTSQQYEYHAQAGKRSRHLDLCSQRFLSMFTNEQRDSKQCPSKGWKSRTVPGHKSACTIEYNKHLRKSVCYVSVQKGRRRKDVQETIAIGLLRNRLHWFCFLQNNFTLTFSLGNFILKRIQKSVSFFISLQRPRCIYCGYMLTWFSTFLRFNYETIPALREHILKTKHVIS